MQNDQNTSEQRAEQLPIVGSNESGQPDLAMPRIESGARVEKASIATELPQASPSLPPPIMQSQTSSMPQTDGFLGSSAQSQTSNAIATTSFAADDSDLIEKEWVERAKSIIEKTKDNPHMQNQAINQIKADYVKKRYNKDLKASEG